MRLSLHRTRSLACASLALAWIHLTAHGALQVSIAQQAYVKASNAAAGDWFSRAVAVSGDTMVVGAPNEDSQALGIGGDQLNDAATDAGAAYVFIRQGATWIQQAYLKASNAGAGDSFGLAVAISGDTIVIGAWGERSNAGGIDGNQNDNSLSYAGAAYVFTRSGSTWSQQAYLKAPISHASVGFGLKVSVSGDTAAVSVNGQGVGPVYVFVRNGTTWTQQAEIVGSNTEQFDGFGNGLSLSGNTLVVGASWERSSATGVNGNEADNSAYQAGAAYVFVRNGTIWTQQAYLKASNTRLGAFFGSDVSVSGDTIVVGARSEDSDSVGVNPPDHMGATGAGAAYVFTRSGSTWSQQAYLKASNTRVGALFGSAVAVSGNRIVVGAGYEHGGSTGVNGDQLDFTVNWAGSAYVFERTGANWSQTNYLKASNTGTNDWFGTAAAISGDTIAIGAFGEASSASGVDANQSDNGAGKAGAAYVFSFSTDTSPFCSGDGSSRPCPCGSGAFGYGCPNVASVSGASLTASGIASVANDTLILSSEGGLPSGPGLYFQGSAPIATGSPFGNGLLCLTGSTPRLEIRVADGVGASSTTVPIHLLGSTTGGDLRYYQMCYRDDPSFCTGASFNTTNALSLTWAP